MVQFFLFIAIFLLQLPLEEIPLGDVEVVHEIRPQKILFGDFFSVKIKVLTKDTKTRVIFSPPEEDFFINSQLIDIRQRPVAYSWKEKKYKTSMKVSLQAIQTPYIQIPSIPISMVQSSSTSSVINTEMIQLKVQSRLIEGERWEIRPIRMDHFFYLQRRFWKLYFFVFSALCAFLYFSWKTLTRINRKKMYW